MSVIIKKDARKKVKYSYRKKNLIRSEFAYLDPLSKIPPEVKIKTSGGCDFFLPRKRFFSQHTYM